MINEIPEEWNNPLDGEALEIGDLDRIKTLSQHIFQDYEPTQFHPFWPRLINWLNNVECEEQQKMLLYLLTRVFFVSRKEFESLYRSTFNGPISKWLIEQKSLNAFSRNITEEITESANSCWICPVTDSLRINSFLKVNSLMGLDKRPDWRSLPHFGDVEKIHQYIAQKEISHLILLEDFVGSGSQAEPAIRFAATNFPELQVLFCPLIVCPEGHDSLTKIEKKFDNFSYSATLKIPETELFNIKGDISDIDKKIYSFLGELEKRLECKDEEMLGFKGTGAMVVLFSNCPNNTLPIFHKQTSSWTPLFPRVTRQI